MIPPGQVGQVKIQLSTRKLHGDSVRTVTLRTNDPAADLVSLELRARILASVEVFPQLEVRLSNRTPHLSRTRLLVRRDPTESGTLTISDVTTSAPFLTVRAEALAALVPASAGLPPGRPGDWILDLELKEPPPPDTKEAEVRFRTALAREPEIRLPILVEAVPLVRLSAESVVLPAADPGAGPAEPLLGSIRRGLEPSALAVSGEPAGLGVVLEPSGARNFKLHVRWPGAQPADRGRVVLRFGREEFSVPVVVGDESR